MIINRQLLDSELVMRLKEGNHDAFKELYKRFFKSWHIHAFKLLRNDDGTIDMVQDLFEFLWSKRAELEIVNFSAYLYPAVLNRLFTFRLRSVRRNLDLRSLSIFIKGEKLEFTDLVHFKIEERRIIVMP